ncbi:MAG: AAA family ATPase [Leptolyngbya sp. SIO1D8]|nr:AAA family ATPase [Leptolyngbya sp. SIO1D8]
MTIAQASSETDNRIYRGLSLQKNTVPPAKDQLQRLRNLPPPPPWRTFGIALNEWQQEAESITEADFSEQIDSDPRSLGFVAIEKATQIVNAALCLRRPILIEGRPGSGKTSLAYAVARELGLPGPYRWSIVSRTTLREGLYSYDAIGRLQAASLLRQEAGSKVVEAPPVGDFLRLGPMGMAFHQSRPGRPAVLLIDEIDKSDIDMPNDLLHIFEEGFFDIPELTRLQDSSEEKVLPYRGRQQDSEEKLTIPNGCVHCREFPLVLMTSNEAREFPPAFLRRCLRLTLKQPDNEADFYRILEQRFGRDVLSKMDTETRDLIQKFLGRMQDRNKEVRLATDQLLNAVYLLLQGHDLTQEDNDLLDTIYRPL